MEDLPLQTRVLPVNASKIGQASVRPQMNDYLDDLELKLDEQSPDAQHLLQAAEQLKNSNIPVAFPTETVYGLGADATRSDAVKGIYKAKQRPSDNPLIVHFASLHQLRTLLRPKEDVDSHVNGNSISDDPIPAIYHGLIQRFWPGPLTILLPNPPNSSLAPEVTAGLSTFGARMPRHVLALALIRLSGVPVAAPSANASTKPSPTAAEHVAYDLNGRIETIVDGGPCDVGVESTVVDGLSDPPLVLRPGGISIDQIKTCPGWENVGVGYKDVSEKGTQPKAPGMKYRHYSPKATVVLVENGGRVPTWQDMKPYVTATKRVGVIRTRRWTVEPAQAPEFIQKTSAPETTGTSHTGEIQSTPSGFAGMLQTIRSEGAKRAVQRHEIVCEDASYNVLDISLGDDTSEVARGIFAALRDLDKEDVDAIFVEGISDVEGDVAAAVMNRLRKAAEVKLTG